MYKEPCVFLDMDGVLCDFMQGLHDHFDLPYGTYLPEYPYPPDTFDVFPYMDVSAKARAAVMENDVLWANLPWMPDGEDILDVVGEFVHDEDIFLLTRPPLDAPMAYAGKVRWAMENVPHLANQIIPTCVDKGPLFSDRTRILIDDYAINTDSFTSHRGSAILIPRVWNRHHAMFSAEFDIKSYVRSRMKDWADQL